MAKFKVGDRVEMVKRDGCYADFKNPGVVSRVFGDDGDVFFDATDSAGSYFTGADEIRFTAYVEPRAELLKVGQRVRIIGGAWHKIGGIGEIIVVDFGDDEISYKVKVGTNSWWQHNKHVVPVNDTPEVEKSDKHWIISKLNGGSPLPSPHPFKHLSESDAVIETQRLATIHPGVKFVMYAATYEAFVEPPKPVEPDLKLRWL